MRPVHAAAVAGSQTSNLISESPVGLAVPCTRQNGTLGVTPLTVVLAGSSAAAVIVDASGVTEVNCAQLSAACVTPDAPARPRPSALTAAPITVLLVPCMKSPNGYRARAGAPPNIAA